MKLPGNSIRLNKYISESGTCSRREADRYIEMGQVLINGRKANVGDQVSRHDKVIVNGLLIKPKKAEDFIFLAFNKPVGITSTTEIGVKDSIIDYIGFHERIFPIGRLDKDSQGLIFLTNNGDIVNKILRAGNNHEKEYLVTVNKIITDSFIEKMGNGVPMLGEITKKCKVSKESPFVFRITLVQGLNRQIRRMCEYFEYEVVKLERIRIMNISLKGIPPGEWRELEENEMSEIFKAIEHSSSTEEASKTRRITPNKPASKSSQPSNAPRTPKSAQSAVKKGPLHKDDRSMHPKAKELRGKGSFANSKKSDSGKSNRGTAGSVKSKSKGRSAKR